MPPNYAHTAQPAYEDLTVGTFNIENFGHVEGAGNPLLPAALDWLLEQTPTPPDVLALPEASHGLMDGQRPIRRETVHRLARHLDGGWYEPLFSRFSVAGRRNHLHLLLVNTRKVHPLGWYDPEAPDGGKRRVGYAKCEVFGHEVNFRCEHWSGGEGRAEFDAQANHVSNEGNMRKTVLLGDFNADSSWERELHITENLDWYAQCEAQDNLDKLEQKGFFNSVTQRWEVDTRQIDKLRTIYKYYDMGEEFGDPTPTTNPKIGSGLRIDRILRSKGFPAQVVDYHVTQPPRAISDHAYVRGRYRIPVLDSTVAVLPDRD